MAVSGKSASRGREVIRQALQKGFKSGGVIGDISGGTPAQIGVKKVEYQPTIRSGSSTIALMAAPPSPQPSPQPQIISTQTLVNKKTGSTRSLNVYAGGVSPIGERKSANPRTRDRGATEITRQPSDYTKTKIRLLLRQGAQVTRDSTTGIITARKGGKETKISAGVMGSTISYQIKDRPIKTNVNIAPSISSQLSRYKLSSIQQKETPKPKQNFLQQSANLYSNIAKVGYGKLPAPVRTSISTGVKVATMPFQIGYTSAKKAYGYVDVRLKKATSYISPKIEAGLFAGADFARRTPTIKESIKSFVYRQSFDIQKPKTPFGILTREVYPAGLEMYGGGIKEIRTEPTRAVVSYGIGFAFPLALKGIGVVAKPVSMAFPRSYKWGSVAVSGLLAGSYAYDIGKRVSSSPRPFSALGGITATELIPLTVGGMSSSYAYQKTAGYVKTIGKKYRSPEKFVRPSILTGKETFPTAPASKQLRIFQNQYRYALPEEKGLINIKSGYHVTTASLPKKISVLAGTSEVPGMYISSEASVYFLKFKGSSYSLYTKDIFNPFGSGKIVSQKTLGFETIPKSFKATFSQEKLSSTAIKLGFPVSRAKQYPREFEYLVSSAKKGVGIVAPIGKSEIEAIIPSLTQTERISSKYFTYIPSSRQAEKYQFFSRAGTWEAVKRVPKFSLIKPASWLPKAFGKKPGTFISFGIKKGTRVPIETRGILAEELGIAVSKQKGFKNEFISDEYLYPRKKLSYFSLPRSNAYSYIRGGSSYNVGKSFISSSTSSKGYSYQPPSSNIPSSKPPPSSGGGKRSRGGSRGGSPISIIPYYPSPLPPSYTPPYRSPPPPPPTYPRKKYSFESMYKKRKPLKGMFGLRRTFKFTATIVPAQFGIRRKTSKVLSGVSPRYLMPKLKTRF